MLISIQGSGKVILLLSCFVFWTNNIGAQQIDIFLAGKIKRNYSGQDEIVLSDNDIHNYSKELLTFNTIDANAELGIIYRPKENFFVEGRFCYGSDTYEYLAGANAANLGYGGIYNGLPIGLGFIRRAGSFSFNVNGGCTIIFDRLLLDLGAGLAIQPAWENGESSLRIGINYNNERRWVADVDYSQTQTTHIYQNVFARLLVHDSKHKLFNHLGCELGYTNKLFGRFRKSVMDVTYTDSQDRTFVNKHYDFQRSLSFSILYRF